MLIASRAINDVHGDSAVACLDEAKTSPPPCSQVYRGNMGSGHKHLTRFWDVFVKRNIQCFGSFIISIRVKLVELIDEQEVYFVYVFTIQQTLLR